MWEAWYIDSHDWIHEYFRLLGKTTDSLFNLFKTRLEELDTYMSSSNATGFDLQPHAGGAVGNPVDPFTTEMKTSIIRHTDVVIGNIVSIGSQTYVVVQTRVNPAEWPFGYFEILSTGDTTRPHQTVEAYSEHTLPIQLDLKLYNYCREHIMRDQPSFSYRLQKYMHELGRIRNGTPGLNIAMIHDEEDKIIHDGEDEIAPVTFQLWQSFDVSMPEAEKDDVQDPGVQDAGVRKDENTDGKDENTDGRRQKRRLG
jgi:hypothetical protein